MPEVNVHAPGTSHQCWLSTHSLRCRCVPQTMPSMQSSLDCSLRSKSASTFVTSTCFDRISAWETIRRTTTGSSRDWTTPMPTCLACARARTTRLTIPTRSTGPRNHGKYTLPRRHRIGTGEIRLQCTAITQKWRSSASRIATFPARMNGTLRSTIGVSSRSTRIMQVRDTLMLPLE